MLTTHDDLPHPVPPTAYLRYKENWFFIIIDVSNDVYGMAHFNYEPGFDRARVSCNLMVHGETFKYGNQIPFPADFAMSPQIGDDKLRVKFVEAHSRMELRLNTADVDLDLSFRSHAPTFDTDAYDAANPEKPSYQEVMTLATNQLFRHQVQAMSISGTLTLKGTGETIHLKGMGSRDHSRCVRSDNMTFRHIWSFLYFPNTVFGVMSLSSLVRPEITAYAGYIYDAEGMRSLKDIEIKRLGDAPGNMPAIIEFILSDVYGTSYTVIADIENRMGHVSLVAEAPSSLESKYSVVENFCRVSLRETGEQGYALVESGFNSKEPRR